MRSIGEEGKSKIGQTSMSVLGSLWEVRRDQAWGMIDQLGRIQANRKGKPRMSKGPREKRSRGSSDQFVAISELLNSPRTTHHRRNDCWSNGDVEKRKRNKRRRQRKSHERINKSSVDLRRSGSRCWDLEDTRSEEQRLHQALSFRSAARRSRCHWCLPAVRVRHRRQTGG